MRVAALVKQIPHFEDMTLDGSGRLVRAGVPLEMNPYCRRAVAKAIELDSECVVMTMGPPPAQDCLREAIACGAGRGVLLTDRALAGSDTLATARALARLVEAEGPFDLVLVGKNSVDADTGQVGPELAELLGWVFAGPVRELEFAGAGSGGAAWRAECETDAGMRSVEGVLPAVLSCAERLCAPAKALPEERAAVAGDRITSVGVGLLGEGPWGATGSPTLVGRTRVVEVGRSPRILDGPLETQVKELAEVLDSLDLFRPLFEEEAEPAASGSGPGAGREVWAVVEAGASSSLRQASELAAEAVRLKCAIGGRARVIALGGELAAVPPGVDGVALLCAERADAADEDYAAVLAGLVQPERPWAVLAPSTARGREVASRLAAALGLGLTGDAVELDLDAGVLVAWKPAFGGRLVAAITSRSDVQVVTVRPGVLPAPPSGTMRPVGGAGAVVDVPVAGRVRVKSEVVQDDPEALAIAPVVIGVGTGVDPSEYALLEPLRALVGGELAATRKVTDRGWMPRSRQIGITGRAVAPRLFVSIAASGKFNHAVGFRAADFVVAVNLDAEAPVFTHCDVGIVAGWHDTVRLLEQELRSRRIGRARTAAAPNV